MQPLWRTVWRFLKKLNIELAYDPAIPLLVIYPEKTIIQKDTCTQMFIAALFTRVKTLKQPNFHQQRTGYIRCGTSIQWNIMQFKKKNEIMPFSNTDEHRDYHTK